MRNNLTRNELHEDIVKKIDDSATKQELQIAESSILEAVSTHISDNTSHIRYGTAIGTNTKTISLNPAPTNYVEGMAFSFKNSTENTGAVTINVNGLGTKAIVKSNGVAISSGNLKDGSVYTVRYNGTSFILQGEGGGGNLQSNQALAGFTFTNDNGDQIGSGDPNLIPANIKSGVNIFGKVGTLPPLIPGTFTVLDLGSMSYNPSSVSPEYSRVVRIKVLAPGGYRLHFSFRGTDELQHQDAAIFRNGVYTGGQFFNTGMNRQNAVYDFTTINPNDTIEIWVRSSNTRSSIYVDYISIKTGLLGFEALVQ